MVAKSSLPRCAPETQGISSAAITRFVDAVEKMPDRNELHSFMLLRHGAVVAEGWWSPYAPKRPHMLFSLSKSFTSSAVGLAVAEGRLTVEDRVLSFFPDEAPARISKNLDAMQVKHLLAMSTGHADDTMGPLRQRRDGNWIKAFLAHPVKYRPGTHFLYNTGATYMLSAIIQRLTGMMLLDYLQPRLFEPLGIKHPTWEVSPQGINMGGFGLSITTEDIARFGQLYLQKGLWKGKQLLPKTWIEQATSVQTVNGTNPNNDWEQGYGYQFWRCRHGVYRGDGAFGQYCIVMPDQDAVLAITAGVSDMQLVLNLVWEHLLPALSQQKPLPEDAPAHTSLSQRLGQLALAAPQGDVTSPTASLVSKKTFVMEPNALKIKRLTFDFSKPAGQLTIRTGRDTQKITFGAGAWREGVLSLYQHDPCMVASGVWTDEQTFTLTLRFYQTPFYQTLACHFDGDRLSIDGAVNVSFGETAYSLKGQIRP